MKAPRLNIAGAMVFVAGVALELWAIRECPSDLEGYLYAALPMANILVIATIVGIRRPRARPFAIGFVTAGALSLTTFVAWAARNPWTFLRYFEQPSRNIAHLVDRLWPYPPELITELIVAGALALPPTALALAGGCLSATGSATLTRRKAAKEAAVHR